MVEKIIEFKEEHVITDISFESVASYRIKTVLNTDKKVNIVYGLNGTGKSTFSNYFYNPANELYKSCAHSQHDCKVLVYNQQFIKDHFYERDNINGIFSLSKENKEAKEKVETLTEELGNIAREKASTKDSVQAELNKIKVAKEIARKKVWEVKKSYSGGDRVLEFCLKGKMGGAESMFNYLCTIPLPDTKPSKSIEDLKQEVSAIDGDNATTYSMLSKIDLTMHQLSSESSEALKTVIVGSEDSPVAGLIGELKNSDWVSDGLKYLDCIDDDRCPFCQSHTMTEDLVNHIKDYFDETYKRSIAQISLIHDQYDKIFGAIPDLDSYRSNPYSVEYLAALTDFHAQISATLKENVELIGQKLTNPSIKVELVDLGSLVDDFNGIVESINKLITEHNAKIADSDNELERIKKEFWQIIRYEYDQTIVTYEDTKDICQKAIENFNRKDLELDKRIEVREKERLHFQSQTVNIEDAIENINKGLIDIGITDFHIEKYEDELYRLVRTGSEGQIFLSLSEGEKMIISFLYFRELFRGKQTADEGYVKKIAIIDDPVSSLSHIFVYNIGQLIKNEFFNSDKVEQVFVLTHSLYFFYELVDSNRERRKQSQKLFRLDKNTKGTSIKEMKYEEVQNDYQSYWAVINDENQPPALIANCMRNVVEYFFNFVHKADLSNVAQMKELKQPRFQAFIRYINRESHSLGQNIIDFKEFNYNDFKEALKLVFVAKGYPEHYKKMSKI